MQHDLYEYWLAAVPDLPGHIKIKIQEQFPDLGEFHRRFLADPQSIAWLTEPQRQMIRRAACTDQCRPEYEQMEERRVRMITWRDPDYPARLLQLHDSPFAVFVKGSLPDPSGRAVAIVGARACSPYGKIQTEQFASRLALAGCAVVSGMASGVDGIAQQTALDRGSYSLAILGCGVCVCYPEHHRSLYNALTERGGILSEYPIYEQPIKYHFPQRNRLISAMADAVIVIEAREKSGSLITADFALEQGREVFALPGPADSPLSTGCHRLIEQGAHILISPEQLVRDLRSGFEKQTGKRRISGSSDRLCADGLTADESGEDLPDEKLPDGLSETEAAVYRHLSLAPVRFSQLELTTGLDPSVIARTLMNLQLRGLVSELSRQCYIRA